MLIFFFGFMVFGTQHRKGAALQWKFLHMLECMWWGIWYSSVEHARPPYIALARSEAKRNRLVVSIEKDGERIAYDALATCVDFVNLIAKEDHSQTPREARCPIAVGHSLPSGFIR